MGIVRLENILFCHGAKSRYEAHKMEVIRQTFRLERSTGLSPINRCRIVPKPVIPQGPIEELFCYQIRLSGWKASQYGSDC